MAETADNSTENEQVVTAVDIMNQQTALEQEAQEVLPGKFESCTFDQGYIRQALYACKTCTPPDHEPAGMCYSCSIACHSDHELYELFPKRNFRCDCGLPGKFSDRPCELATRRKRATQKNEDNVYNHNFRGLYCRCNALYDPEQEDGVMFQCIVCEDWFHDRCIGDIPSDIEDFEGYVCRDCTDKYPFLVTECNPWLSIGLCKGNDKIHQWIIHQGKHEPSPSSQDTVQPGDTQSDDQNERKRKLESHAEPEAVKKTKMQDGSSVDLKKCNTKTLPEGERAELFLMEGWRSHLCRCDKCHKAYVDNNLGFMLEEETTFEPEEDEDAGKSLFEIGMEHLMRMDRVRAIEGALAFQALSNQIREFLQEFKDSNEVVTEADIRRFFEEKRLELQAQNDH